MGILKAVTQFSGIGIAKKMMGGGKKKARPAGSAQAASQEAGYSDAWDQMSENDRAAAFANSKFKGTDDANVEANRLKKMRMARIAATQTPYPTSGA